MSTASPPGGDTVTIGFLFNLLGRSVTLIGGGIVSILLARHFKAELFGQWAVASVYATLVGTVVDGGLGRLLIRDAARDPDNAGAAVGRVLKGRGLLAAVVVPLALIVAWFQVSGPGVWALVLVLILARITTDALGTLSSALYAFDRFRVSNLLEAWRRGGLVVAAVLVVVLDLELYWMALASLLVALAGSRWLIKEVRTVLRFDFSRGAFDNAGDAFWFWSSGIFFWINGEIDQLMLSKISGDKVTGIYAAAVRLVALSYVIPRAVNDTVIRRLFRSAKDGLGLNRQLNTTVMILGGLGGAIGVLLYFNGPEIIALVYGASYQASGQVLSIYGLFLAMFFVRSAPSWFLTSSDRVPLATLFLAGACATNIGLNLWLIPRDGAVGAAWSTVFSEVFLLVAFLGTALRMNGRRLATAIALSALPAGLTILPQILLSSAAPWWLRGGLGAALGLVGLAAGALALRRNWNPLGIMDDAAAPMGPAQLVSPESK